MKRKLITLLGTKTLKLVNILALFLAIISVDSTCVWVHHQPQLPDKLKMVKSNKIHE